MYYKVSCDIFFRVKFRIFFLSILIQIWSVKHSASIFPLYFQLPYLPEETCFRQAGSSAVEGTSQDIPGSSAHRKVLAGLSLFLKSEKIPALIYEGKGLEYRPFPHFRPVSSAYQPGAQIWNHGRQALLLYTKFWQRASFTRSTHVCEVLPTFFVTGEIKLSFWCHS